MNKKYCAWLGAHIVIVAGIVAGHVCMCKQNKKSKLNYSSLD